jgi:hypothetical protein
METDISRIGEFEPSPLNNDFQEFQQAPPQYQQQQSQPQYDYMYHQQQAPPEVKKFDFFADIDKKAWIFILIALILGFFMGKTMQPIILRSV